MYYIEDKDEGGKHITGNSAKSNLHQIISRSKNKGGREV
jgi:hypothetical protein